MEEILLVNPRRRKRRRHANPRRHRRAHARRRKGGFRRRRLMNPRFSVRSVTGEITPAIIGAAGALVLDIGMAYLPLPDMLKAGWGKTVAQLAAALALGFVAAKVPGVTRRTAQVGTLGALTVVAYNAIRPLAAQAIGDKVRGLSGLADFGDFEGNTMGAYMNAAPALLPRSPVVNAQTGMGAYMQRQLGTAGNDFF